MSTDQVNVRDGLFRQRRALLAASSVLLLYVAAGIRIEELAVLGNKVYIERPEFVPLALWILWLYFLVRYLQYFHDLKDVGFRQAYDDRLHWVLKKVAHRKLRRRFLPEGIVPDEYPPPYDFKRGDRWLAPFGRRRVAPTGRWLGYMADLRGSREQALQWLPARRKAGGAAHPTNPSRHSGRQ